MRLPVLSFLVFSRRKSIVMKGTAYKLLVLVSLAGLISCSSEEKPEERPENLKKFAWLEDQWKTERNKAIYEENWKWEDGKYTGTGIMERDGEKIQKELWVEEMGTDVFYKMSNPMKKGEVNSYQYHPTGTDSFVFINDNVNYPRRIVYQIISKDSVAVELSGNPGNGGMRDSFTLVRKL